MHLIRIVRASEIVTQTEKKFILHPLPPEFVQQKTKHVAAEKKHMFQMQDLPFRMVFYALTTSYFPTKIMII